MAPAWFYKNELPFEKMWIDDKEWLPLVLEGKCIEGTFSFSEKGATIATQQIRIIS